MIKGFDSYTVDFTYYIHLINKQFINVIEKGRPLFKTNADDLFEAFLLEIPNEYRQRYTCSACKKFVEDYGNIVALSKDGKVEAALWGDFDGLMAPAFRRLKELVEKADIVDVFITSKEILGVPCAGGFNHMHINVPDKIRYTGKIHTDMQMMFEKREDFRMLQQYIEEYPYDVAVDANNILNSEHLYRFEKCLGISNWYMELHKKLQINKKYSDNILWYAVATVPPGYCHIKNTMIGTLLDDIKFGLDFDTIANRFAKKMNPLQYQRPQTNPTRGNIEQGEKIVEKLGIKKSFSRRYARLDELNTIWEYNDFSETTGKGFFGHIKIKNVNKTNKSVDIPATKITWKKFEKTVLTNASKIEFLVPKNGNFAALLTATHQEAPPIFQWDNLEKRNPFSWYVYTNGSPCTRWNLKNDYCNVTGICYQPSMWYGEYPHQGKSIFILLDSAKDVNGTQSNCLFPEMLINDLREIRKTIEAYSKEATLQGVNEASACGYRLDYGREWNVNFRVTTSTGLYNYILDRWD